MVPTIIRGGGDIHLDISNHLATLHLQQGLDQLSYFLGVICDGLPRHVALSELDGHVNEYGDAC